MRQSHWAECWNSSEIPFPAFRYSSSRYQKYRFFLFQDADVLVALLCAKSLFGLFGDQKPTNNKSYILDYSTEGEQDVRTTLDSRYWPWRCLSYISCVQVTNVSVSIAKFYCKRFIAKEETARRRGQYHKMQNGYEISNWKQKFWWNQYDGRGDYRSGCKPFRWFVIRKL